MKHKDYLNRMHELIEDLFTDAERRRIDNDKLADMAGLDPRTVQRISDYTTELPRLKTIMSLARVLGRDVTLSRSPFKLSGKRSA